MDTRLATDDLKSQLAASREKIQALALEQAEAEGRARSLLKPGHELSPEDDGTISWATVLEKDVERCGVDNADPGMGEMRQNYSSDLENGRTVLSHSGLVVLGNSSDILDRRRRGLRTWRSGDAVELLEGLWHGVKGCCRGLFLVLGVRMETGEERMPLVGV